MNIILLIVINLFFFNSHAVSSDNTLTTMSNKRICVEATQRGQVKKWETNPKFLKFVDEAKLRNLDCNVVTEINVDFPDFRQTPFVRKFDINSYYLDDLPGFPYDGYLSGPKFDKLRKKFVYVDLYFNFNKDGKLEYNSILVVDTNDETQEHFIKLSISYLILFESSLFEDVTRINRNKPENLTGIVRFVSKERSKEKFYLGENFENLDDYEKKQFDFGVKFTKARFPIIMLAFHPNKNYQLNKENNSILFKIEKLNYFIKNDVNKIPQKLEKKIKSKYLKLNDQILNKITKFQKDIKSLNLDVKELSNLNLITELKKENITLAQDIKINKSKYQALNNKITDIRKLKLYKKEDQRLSDLSSDHKRKYVAKVALCYDKIPSGPLKSSLGGQMLYIDSVRNNVNEAFLAAEQLSQAIKLTFNYKIVCP